MRRNWRKSEPFLGDVPERVDLPHAGNDASKRRRTCLPSFVVLRPTSPTSSRKRMHGLRALVEMLGSCVRRQKMAHVILAGVALSTLAIILSVHAFRVFLGFRGSMKGGSIGYLVDQFSRDLSRYRTTMKWREEIRSELRIPIAYDDQGGALIEPKFYPFIGDISTRPNAAVVETLIREKRRKLALESMKKLAKQGQLQCKDNSTSEVRLSSTLLQGSLNTAQAQLPPYWITRPDLGIEFAAIHDRDEPLVPTCHSSTPRMACVLHSFGGIQMNNSFDVHQARSEIETALNLARSIEGGRCESKVGYAVISNRPTPDSVVRKSAGSVSSRVSTLFALFPANHPASVCIPSIDNNIPISFYNEANAELDIRSTFANKLVASIEGSSRSDQVWGVATLPCDIDTLGEAEIRDCCDQASVSLIDSVKSHAIVSDLLSGEPKSHHLLFTVSSKDESINRNEQHWMRISEPTRAKGSPVTKQKNSLQMDLRRKKKCEPGWICNRCLQSVYYGSFSRCTSTCGRCAGDTICGENENVAKVQIEVEAKGLMESMKGFPTQVVKQRIPRIIHQTYFEEITIEKHPQLFRLQNTWKSSGWEYRFYTDETARRYIADNYPQRFVEVFDSIYPGAYKADYFRYLVLFRDGGLYVDVDVMLNGNLDNFISSDLGFFAPIDAVGAFADEQFCIWNGLLGSAPAHPVLKNVIEWMVNLVSKRGDLYDIERGVCHLAGHDSLESWKIRAEPGLVLSGPCALGLALNIALGNKPLQRIRTGLLRWNDGTTKDLESKNSVGNVMILLADKNDLGAFRFSDSERNILLASTDLQGLTKTPLRYEGEKPSHEKPKPHYSKSTQGHQIWGAQGVYSDDMATNEEIVLHLKLM